MDELVLWLVSQWSVSSQRSEKKEGINFTSEELYVPDSRSRTTMAEEI